MPHPGSVAQTLQTGHAIGTVHTVPLDKLVALLVPKCASVGGTVAALRARCAAAPACLHPAGGWKRLVIFGFLWELGATLFPPGVQWDRSESTQSCLQHRVCETRGCG